VKENEEREQKRREAIDRARPLPQAIDAEKGILGSILQAPDRVLEENRWLAVEHFWHPAHQVIFERLVAMREKVIPIDLITLTQKLEDAHELEHAGGAAYVTDLFNFVPAASNAAYYAQIVLEMARRRGVIFAGHELARRGYEQEGASEQLLDDCESELLRLRADRSFGEGMRKLALPLKEALDGIEEIYKHRGSYVHPITGLTDFDRMTSGLKPGQFVVFGARPSVGKTALATQCARELAAAGHPVAIFSLEMTSQEIAQRLLCAAGEIELNNVRYGLLKKTFGEDLMKEFLKLEPLPIWIEDTPALTCFDFRAKARRVTLKRGIKVIFVDYLQLMRSTSLRARESRAIEVAEISMTLKATAKELGVTIVACAQLGRDADRTATPHMSDLKESGQIEQDADVIALLHRPDKDSDEVKLIIAKQRNGPTGSIPLRFEREYARFHNVTKKPFSKKEEERQRLK
jgi:replicative DNA helicase